jgi:hypothetical protein
MLSARLRSDLFYDVVLNLATTSGRELTIFYFNTVHVHELIDFLTSIGIEGHWIQSGVRLRQNRIFEWKTMRDNLD